MQLVAGRRLAHFEIVASIGAGGMGEVYRARDTKLDRDVAIKVLPEEFAKDDERLARFEREAKLLASLNHPNIASIYGFEGHALVLELVEGPTLAERIERGPIPIDEAIAIAKQIAEALEAGHEAGVIHRDLKPANVKVKDDGTVKVLDYGLAKALASDVTASPDSELSQSPTLTRQGTQIGVILGTAAYMSPEQAKGKRVDKRTDIWAFGAVLYEMLTGRKAFQGEDVSETLASVIKSEPDWSQLPPGVSPRLRELLGRCAVKDPVMRLRDIGDARLELMRADENADPAAAESLAKRAWPIVAAALVAGILAWSLKPSSSDSLGTNESVTRVSINLPDEQELFFGTSRQAPSFAISSDGRILVYSAQEEGVRRLYVRALDAVASEPLDGTEDAEAPFFSPDGDWVGFFSDGRLRKVSLSTGLRASLSPVQERSRGACWTDRDTIVFTSGENSGLVEISADGGDVRTLTTVDEAAGERGHLWPSVAGNHVLYTIRRDTGFDIGSVDVATGATKVVIEGVRQALVTPTGHLVYGDSRNLYAAPFDLGRAAVLRPAVPIGNDVHRSPGGGASFFAFSGSGALVYASNPEAELVWVDRQGSVEPLGAGRGDFFYVRLSEDGSRLAYGSDEVGVLDLERGTRQRLDGASYPVWRPGTGEVSVFDMHNGLEQIFNVKADGSEAPYLLLEGQYPQSPADWSRDGTTLLFHENHPVTEHDVWILREDGTTVPYLATPAVEINARFSPDEKYVAYESEASGEVGVYVRDFPNGQRQWVVSSDGREPVWSRDGNELFFKSGDDMMVVEVATEPEFRAGKPTRLFRAPNAWGSVSLYDVTPDGKRFVMVRGIADQFRELHVVTSWFDELNRLVPPS